MLRIGVDLGGSKIEGIALSPGGAVLARHRQATPLGDYRQTVKAICALVARLESDVGGAGTVGIGIPGVVSPATGLVKNANSTWLIGRPFDRDVAESLGRPVRVANDANCFAVSEAVDGAAAGADVVFGLILGSGCGAGLVVKGEAVTGRHAIAGEWGHNPLPWPTDSERPGRRCYCGRNGCIETWVSGPGLVADSGCDGADSAAAVFDLSRGGAAKAKAAVERFLDRLARSLAMVINILDPDVVVVGGGLSNAPEIYSELPGRLPHYVFSDSCDTPIRHNVHGDASGVRGAAWLWPLGEGAS